jgi:hypothetical protein
MSASRIDRKTAVDIVAVLLESLRKFFAKKFPATRFWGISFLENGLNQRERDRWKIRSAHSARGTNFRHLGRAKRGSNGKIKPTSN